MIFFKRCGREGFLTAYNKYNTDDGWWMLHKMYEWELSEIKHQSHFIPYGVDWKQYFDVYPYDYLFDLEGKDDNNCER